MFARLAIVALVASAGALPISPSTDGTNSKDLRTVVGAKLSSAISSANNVAYGVSIDIPGYGSRSMDCMMIMKDTDTSLIAVFHAGQSGGDTDGDHTMSALHLARANVTKPGEVPGTGSWVHQAKLSARGSMGYFKQVKDSEAIFLAYEIENLAGNRVALRLYESKEKLLRNDWVREVQMDNKLKGAEGDLQDAHNMGTPSIANIVELNGRYSLSVQFHYYIASDIPGEGIIDFPREGGGVVDSAYPWWGATFSEINNNAIRIAKGQGKIGQRALLLPPNAKGTTLLLYEAQMAEAGEDDCGWLSWRLFLQEDGKTGGAVRLDVEMPGNLKTFANPHANVVGDYIYLGFFVPSQPFDPNPENRDLKYQKPDEYDQCAGKQSTDSRGNSITVGCETCADEPMQKAQSPANFGSMLLSVKLSDIFA